MPTFGRESKAQLATCHPYLQKLFNTVIEFQDCRVLQGWRGEAEQNAAYRSGHSTKKWGESKHNHTEKLDGKDVPYSLGVDVAPFFAEKPHIRWKDTESFCHFAGFVLGVAAMLGIQIRWGGDWDSDQDLHDQTFNDLVHFELKRLH